MAPDLKGDDFESHIFEFLKNKSKYFPIKVFVCYCKFLNVRNITMLIRADSRGDRRSRKDVVRTVVSSAHLLYACSQLSISESILRLSRFMHARILWNSSRRKLIISTGKWKV